MNFNSSLSAGLSKHVYLDINTIRLLLLNTLRRYSIVLHLSFTNGRQA